MIKIENVDVHGFEAAIRGMRNPMNSWEKSDSCWKWEGYEVGQNDRDLMMRLAKAGTEHAKYQRMITVTADVVAPDYFFKEFSTYRVGVTENSTSTMHRIHAKEFEPDDFSHEWLMRHAGVDDPCLVELEDEKGEDTNCLISPAGVLSTTISSLNFYRKKFIESGDKVWWWQIIQLLPMSYNYRRTICLNYQVLANIYRQRKNHKLDEWRKFCEWIKTLPCSELITLEE